MDIEQAAKYLVIGSVAAAAIGFIVIYIWGVLESKEWLWWKRL
jgi:hypothetical protein